MSVEILIGSVLALGALFLHETPRYVHGSEKDHRAYKYACIIIRFLVKKHKDAKALKVLVKIRRDHTKAQSEFMEIQSSIRNSRSQVNWFQTMKYFCSGSIIQR